MAVIGIPSCGTYNIGIEVTFFYLLTSIGRTGIERSSLRLRNFLNFTIKLRSRGLVKLDLLFQPSRSDGIQHAKHPDAIAVGGVFWHIETDLDVRHGSQVVNFRWLDRTNDGNQVGSIAKISVMEKDLDSSFVTVLVDVVNTTSVEAGRSSHNAVHLQNEVTISIQGISKIS